MRGGQSSTTGATVSMCTLAQQSLQCDSHGRLQIACITASAISPRIPVPLLSGTTRRCALRYNVIPRDASERSLVFLSLTAGEQFTSQEYKDNVDGNGYAIAKVVSLLLFGHFLRAIVLFEVSPSELWAHCSCIIH